MLFVLSVVFSAVIAAAGAVPTSTNRIVGGWEANENQFPHQVSLKVFWSHICGGSIISEKYILTAAHCTSYGTWLTTVDVGSTKVNKGSSHSIKKITNHKGYGNFQNDVALLELSQPLVFSESVQPIPWATNEVPEGAEIEISGWGVESTNGISPPTNLKYNILKKSSEKECKDLIEDIYYDGIICLSHTQNNGACFGDSGGPATFDGTLVGVASFVNDGCGTTNPDGYAKVSYFNDWIKENTGL